MRRLFQRMCTFCKSEGGPTSVEYAILLVLILAVYLTAVQTFGRNTWGVFNRTDRAIRTNSRGS